MKYVTVCASCLRASCWLGLFYCDNYKTAGLTVISHRKAAAMKLEHKSYYTNPQVQAQEFWQEAR